MVGQTVLNRHICNEELPSLNLIVSLKFVVLGWTRRLQSRWLTLAWHGTSLIKSITAFKTTKEPNFLSNGWPLRVYRLKNLPPNLM